MKIDYSQLQTYVNCPKKYYYKYIECIQKAEIEEGEQTRSFGSAIHAGLAAYFGCERDIGKAIETFRREYPDSLPGENARTTDNGVRLLQEWEVWWKQNFMLAEVLEIEGVSEYAIGDVQYMVKIDLIIKMNDNIYVVDWKTTTAKTHYFFMRFDPNMQVSGYCKYAELKYGQCSGFIPVAMQFGFRKRKYMGEPAGFWCKFDYDIINRSKEQLVDFEENVLSWVKKLEQERTEHVWSKNEGDCMSFKGCQYRALCISCGDSTVKENMYKKVDPFKYLKEEGK